MAIFCPLTFPVGGAFFPICAAVMFVSARCSGALSRWALAKIGGVAAGFVVFLAFMPLLAFSGKGGADLPFSWSGVVEFFLARIFLYPFLPTLYSHLSDFLTILLVLPFLLLMFVLIRRAIGATDEFRSRVLFVAGCFVVYYLATVIMRRGFTSAFGSYQSSFPDRYFFGLNLLLVLLVLLLVDRSRWLVNKWRRFALGAIVFALFGFGAGLGSSFEMWAPQMAWKEFGTFAYAVCKGGAEAKALIPPSLNTGSLIVSIPPDRLAAVRESCRRSKHAF